jgi:hypothetical protein
MHRQCSHIWFQGLQTVQSYACIEGFSFNRVSSVERARKRAGAVQESVVREHLSTRDTQIDGALGLAFKGDSILKIK